MSPPELTESGTPPGPSGGPAPLRRIAAMLALFAVFGTLVGALVLVACVLLVAGLGDVAGRMAGDGGSDLGAIAFRMLAGLLAEPPPLLPILAAFATAGALPAILAGLAVVVNDRFRQPADWRFAALAGGAATTVAGIVLARAGSRPPEALYILSGMIAAVASLRLADALAWRRRPPG